MNTNFNYVDYLWDDKKGYLVVPYHKYAYIKHSNGQHVSLYGDRLKRVTNFDKDDPTLHESDVPPITIAKWYGGHAAVPSVLIFSSRNFSKLSGFNRAFVSW